MMLAAFLGGGEVLLLLGLGGVISLLLLVFWIWMLIDCVRNQRLSDNERVVWTIVIALTHALGAFIYLLAGRNKPA
jgi:hypothetical protein